MASLGTALNDAISAAVRLAFRDLGIETWRRNGPPFSHASPGGRWLDLTFHLPAHADEKIRAQAWKRFTSLRKILPLGEASFLHEGNRDTIARHQNPYELARDPIFCRKAGVSTDTSIDPAARVTYLLRMLAGDLGKLRSRPRRRRSIWQGHLAHVGLATSQAPDAASLCAILEDEFLIPHGRSSQLPLAAVLRHCVLDKGNFAVSLRELLDGPPERDAALLLLFPRLWLQHTVNRAWQHHGALALLGEADRQLLAAQLGWELCSLLLRAGFPLSSKEEFRLASQVLRLAHKAQAPIHPELAACFSSAAPLPRLKSVAVFCSVPWSCAHVDPDGQLFACPHGSLPLQEAPSPIPEPLPVLLKSPAAEALRTAMTGEEAPAPCEGCRELEAANAASLRLPGDPARLPPPALRELTVTLPGRCDRSCRRCAPDEPAKPDSVATEGAPGRWSRLLEGCDDSLRRVTFRSIEPFGHPEHREVLEALIAQANPSRITLAYECCGAVVPEEHAHPETGLWRHFEKVELHVWLPGVGERTRFLQPAFEWESVDRSLQALAELDERIQLNLGLRLDACSVYYLPESVDWIVKNCPPRFNAERHEGRIPYLLEGVSPLQSIQACPPTLKPLIRERLEAVDYGMTFPSLEIGAILQYMNHRQADPAALRFFIEKQQNENGLPFAEFFPELAPHFLETGSRPAN